MQWKSQARRRQRLDGGPEEARGHREGVGSAGVGDKRPDTGEAIHKMYLDFNISAIYTFLMLQSPASPRIHTYIGGKNVVEIV